MAASAATAATIPEAFVYDAIRTPRGRGKKTGALHEVKPVSLVVGLIDELRRRFPDLDPSAIDDLVLGCVTPIGDQGSDIAKVSAIAAGLADTTGGVQLNRFCSSGLEAVNQAAQRIRSGWEDLILAGGVESMSRVPMASDGGAWAMDPETAFTTNFVPQGIGADLIATLGGWTRTDVDGYAAESQARAAKAEANGYFAGSVVPIKDRNGLTILDHEEFIRPGTTVETLAGLKPSFAEIGEQGGFDSVALEKYHWVEQIDHVHHAGNSSGIVDGAADHADGSCTRSPKGARQGRAGSRRHRPVRDERGVRGRRDAVHARPRPPARHRQRQRRRHRDGPPVGGDRSHAARHPHRRVGAARPALRTGHALRRRRHGCRHDRRAALTTRG
jgi:acetyl-CoA acetyltransferase